MAENENMLAQAGLRFLDYADSQGKSWGHFKP